MLQIQGEEKKRELPLFLQEGGEKRRNMRREQQRDLHLNKRGKGCRLFLGTDHDKKRGPPECRGKRGRGKT